MKSVRVTLETNAYFLQVTLRIRFCNDTIVFRENAVLNKIPGVVNTVTISWSLKRNKPITEMKIMRFYYWGSWGVYSAQKDCHIILNFLYNPSQKTTVKKINLCFYLKIFKCASNWSICRFLDKISFLDMRF